MTATPRRNIKPRAGRSAMQLEALLSSLALNSQRSTPGKRLSD